MRHQPRCADAFVTAHRLLRRRDANTVGGLVGMQVVGKTDAHICLPWFADGARAA